MDAFAKNLRALIDEKQLNQSKLAESIGVSPMSVSNWLNRGMVPSMEILELIMELYGLSYDDLLSEQYGYFKKTHGGFDSKGLAAANPKPAYAPLYGTVHAGSTNEPELIDDCVPIPYEVFQGHKHGYFLRVVGDCMDKVYPEGCYVFVDPEMAPRSGSIGVVAVDGSDYIMRRLYKGASVLVLSPESHNDCWEDTVIDSTHEVKLIGTVVWFQPAEELS